MQYRLYMFHNEDTDTFSFALKNIRKTPAAFTLDVSASKNLISGVPNGRATRYIQSGATQFMMHVEAGEDIEEFTLSYSVSIDEI